MNELIRKAVDAASVALLDEPPRAHLGASQIGKRCTRQAWYGFRWAWHTSHGGRMLRLFNRGHTEEDRIICWLRAAGVVVYDYSERLLWLDVGDRYECVTWAYDWQDDVALGPFGYKDVSEDPAHIKRSKARKEGPGQWQFNGELGMVLSHDQHGAPMDEPSMSHYQGSGDGVLERGKIQEWFPNLELIGRGLLECKTAKETDFNRTVKLGLLQNHPEHYNQMQQYMHYFGLKWGLYITVNKNNDDIYYEIVFYKPEVAEAYIDRARAIIKSREAPPRITEDPSWFECKFCDYREICHYQKEPHKSCRSCAYASAEADGRWYCNLYGDNIPNAYIMAGCEAWVGIR